MKTCIKLLSIIFIFSFTTFATDNNNTDKKIAEITNNIFTNLLAQARKKYPDIIEQRERLTWTLSNLWLSIDQYNELLDSSSEEVITYINKFQNDVLKDYYNKSLKLIDQKHKQLIDKLMQQKKELQEKYNRAKLSGRRKSKIFAKSLSEKLKKLQTELKKRQLEFDKLKNKNINSLNKQISSLKLQLKKVEKSAKNLKIPKIHNKKR